MTLLAVPNVSEGRDEDVIATLEAAFGGAATILDRHSDRDHNRTVFTLAGERGPLMEALVSGAEAAIERIDMSAQDGLHPCVGALDVCPVVWLEESDRDDARSEALAVAEQIGGLGVPVFLYGELATRPSHRERAYFRQGGLGELLTRMDRGELRPDWGPSKPHPRAGATLVTARQPLAAFNVELNTGRIEVARAVAAALRESGGGPPGVRAIGLRLGSGRAQVSINVHDPIAVPLVTLIDRIRVLAAPHGAKPIEAELVGLIPEAALEDYPLDLPIRGFDWDRHVIERRLAPK